MDVFLALLSCTWARTDDVVTNDVHEHAQILTMRVLLAALGTIVLGAVFDVTHTSSRGATRPALVGVLYLMAQHVRVLLTATGVLRVIPLRSGLAFAYGRPVTLYPGAHVTVDRARESASLSVLGDANPFVASLLRESISHVAVCFAIITPAIRPRINPQHAVTLFVAYHGFAYRWNANTLLADFWDHRAATVLCIICMATLLVWARVATYAWLVVTLALLSWTSARSWGVRAVATDRVVSWEAVRFERGALVREMSIAPYRTSRNSESVQISISPARNGLDKYFDLTRGFTHRPRSWHTLCVWWRFNMFLVAESVFMLVGLAKTGVAVARYG